MPWRLPERVGRFDHQLSIDHAAILQIFDVPPARDGPAHRMAGNDPDKLLKLPL
jgi:hypothetical protein